MGDTNAYTGMSSLIVALLGMTGVLLLAYFVVWYLGRRMNMGGGSRYIKVIDRVPLGGEKQLLLVKTGEKTLLVGVTSRHTEVLCDLSDDGSLLSEQSQTGSGSPFAGVLEKKLSDLGAALRKGRDKDA